MPFDTEPMKIYTIDSLEAIQEFFSNIINLFSCSLYPDDGFTDMVDMDGNPAFSIETVLYLDLLMDNCFDFCTKNGIDIYKEGLDVQIPEYKKLGMLSETFGADVEGD